MPVPDSILCRPRRIQRSTSIDCHRKRIRGRSEGMRRLQRRAVAGDEAGLESGIEDTVRAPKKTIFHASWDLML